LLQTEKDVELTEGKECICTGREKRRKTPAAVLKKNGIRCRGSHRELRGKIVPVEKGKPQKRGKKTSLGGEDLPREKKRKKREWIIVELTQRSLRPRGRLVKFGKLSGAADDKMQKKKY